MVEQVSLVAKVFLEVFIDLIIGLLGLIIKPFHDQTVSWA
jgi:hypothetical protein